jgi:cardiolipin synthase
LLLPALGMLLLVGCNPMPVASDRDTELEPDTTPAQFYREEHFELAPSNVEAHLDKGRLYLAYDVDGRPVTLVGRITEGSDDLPPDRTVIQRLDPLPYTSWEMATRDAAIVPVLDKDRWNQLLALTMASLLPDEPGAGIVVDVLLLEELFVYRDENGLLHTVPIAFKPPAIDVSASYTFAQLLRQAQGFLNDLADEEGRPPTALLFATGDLSSFGYPFAYADTRVGRFNFLHDDNLDTRGTATPQLVTLVSTLGHTVNSHVQVPIENPVSSLARLFTLVAQTTPDLVMPTTLALVGNGAPPPLADGPGMDLVTWESQLDELVGVAVAPGRLHYLVDGAAFFPRLIDVIGKAEQSIDLRLYIFDNDDYALQIADLLKSRSREVDIRVLLDGLGTIGGANADAPSVPPSHSAPWSVTNYLRRDSAVQVRVLRNAWLMGDHSKSIVIDDRLAFIGGMNIGREYRYDWHDLMVEVDGPVVGLIREDFEKSWKGDGLLGDLQRLLHRGPGTLPSAGPEHYPVRVLFTRPGNPQILHAQIAAIRAARQRIYLENAYLTSDAIIYELARARARGVDVRVIIPTASDSGVISRSNVLAANTMLRHGIRVFVYPGMSHVKAAVYDGWACFGSANFDYLSLRVNKELNLATSHAPAVDALVAQLFQPDFVRSIELTEPLPSNWSDYLVEMLADFL